MFEWKFVTVRRGRYFLFKIDISFSIFSRSKWMSEKGSFRKMIYQTRETRFKRITRWISTERLKGRDQLSNEFSFLYLQGSFATLAWNKSILPRAKHRVTRNGLKRGLTPLILCRCVTRGKRSNWQVKHGYPLIPSYYAFAWFPGNVFDSVRGFLLRGVVRPPVNVIFASHCILVYGVYGLSCIISRYTFHVLFAEKYFTRVSK